MKQSIPLPALDSRLCPQTPGGEPVLGHLREIRKDILGFYVRAMHAGPAVRFQFGPATGIALSDPDAIKSMLMDQAADFEKGAFAEGLAPLVGQGLLTAASAPHRRLRKLAAPAFHPQRIAGYADMMTSLAVESMGRWRDGAVIDLNAEMMRLTLRIVSRALFDIDMTGDVSDIGAALTQALEFINDRQLSLFKPPLWLPLPAHRAFLRAVARLDAEVQKIISARRADGRDHGDLLSMLLAAQDADAGALSDAELRDEAMTIFLAGHETTANALTWAGVLLSTHPAVWLKLREEVVRVLGTRAPTLADLPALPYALQVFKETLRLYPPAYIFGRQALRDVKLGALDVPRGTVMVVCAYALHRNQAIFPDPERFNTERFTPEFEAGLHKYAYLPFGGGARVCIGNQFALMEGQLVLAALAQRVKLELLQKPVVPDPKVTLRPKGGVAMKVRRL